MGRPSNLSARQWDDLGQRLLYGERAADLARGFKVSKSAITARFSEQHRIIRRVAGMLMEVDDALRCLEPAAQLAALRLAEELRTRAAAERMVADALLPRMAPLWRP